MRDDTCVLTSCLVHGNVVQAMTTNEGNKALFGIINKTNGSGVISAFPCMDGRW